MTTSNLPDAVQRVPLEVSNAALKQSTVRNGPSIPGDSGAIRTINQPPMAHEKPVSGDGTAHTK